MRWAGRGGRHLLRVPGPTGVPEGVLRAVEFPTIDHRGPGLPSLREDVPEAVALGPAAPVPAR